MSDRLTLHLHFPELWQLHPQALLPSGSTAFVPVEGPWCKAQWWNNWHTIILSWKNKACTNLSITLQHKTFPNGKFNTHHKKNPNNNLCITNENKYLNVYFICPHLLTCYSVVWGASCSSHHARQSPGCSLLANQHSWSLAITSDSSSSSLSFRVGRGQTNLQISKYNSLNAKLQTLKRLWR